jgi:hypothetical protein
VQWSALLKKDGPAEPKAQYQWLREKHHLGHVAAKILSGQLKAYDNTDALVDKQYSGKAAALRPLYEAVLAAAKKLGKDVTPQPCKTYVPLHHQVRASASAQPRRSISPRSARLAASSTFAVIKPGPGRVDVGLVLGKTAPAGRLQKAKHLGSDRVTHKIEVRSKKDVDAELRRWLKKAYSGT